MFKMEASMSDKRRKARIPGVLSLLMKNPPPAKTHTVVETIGILLDYFIY